MLQGRMESPRGKQIYFLEKTFSTTKIFPERVSLDDTYGEENEAIIRERSPE
jgi:hypothetical protein